MIQETQKPQLNIPVVSGSDSKCCENCKYHDEKTIGCNHDRWDYCVVRDKNGIVIGYNYHEYHYR